MLNNNNTPNNYNLNNTSNNISHNTKPIKQMPDTKENKQPLAATSVVSNRPHSFDLSVYSNQRMKVLQQQAVAEGVFSKNGVTKNVYSVVKNHPFHVQLGVEHSNAKYGYFFSQLTIDVVLLYDCAGEKEVQFVKSAPVEYSTVIVHDASKDSEISKATVEVVVKVLSSQHEDSFFLLKFLVKDREGRYLPLLTTYSHPIRVVSKPNQALKSKRIKSVSPDEEEGNLTVVGQKRKPTEDTPAHKMDQVIHKILENQEEQKQMTMLILNKLSELDRQIKALSAAPASQTPAPAAPVNSAPHPPLALSAGAPAGLSNGAPKSMKEFSQLNPDFLQQLLLHQDKRPKLEGSSESDELAQVLKGTDEVFNFMLGDSTENATI
eukprot:TRINITY_DN3246_c0_g3_i1.p1 TRINITY_DN3246_c0_g3~~TRINITY_DN3246_c0_g3_i1.p1  ORF type:complete len:378 (-),score=94.18 TRINITY_DN3246_c0_g3_i1:54-1187(-)